MILLNGFGWDYFVSPQNWLVFWLLVGLPVFCALWARFFFFHSTFARFVWLDALFGFTCAVSFFLIFIFFYSNFFYLKCVTGLVAQQENSFGPAGDFWKLITCTCDGPIPTNETILMGSNGNLWESTTSLCVGFSPENVVSTANEQNNYNNDYVLMIICWFYACITSGCHQCLPCQYRRHRHSAAATFN